MDPLVLAAIAVIVLVIVLRVFLKVTGLILKIAVLIGVAFLLWLLFINLA